MCRPFVAEEMPRRYRVPVVICLLWCAQTLAQTGEVPEASAVREATAVVASLHDALFELGAGKELSIDQRYILLVPIVNETHDLPFIARFVLRRFWDDLDATERAQFVERFATLSVMNYASRFAGFDPEMVDVSGAESVNATRVQVDATLQTPEDGELTLSYTLHRADEKWMIVNIVASGVSDLALRRSEYSKVMNEDGYDGLLKYVEGQTARLAEGIPQF